MIKQISRKYVKVGLLIRGRGEMAIEDNAKLWDHGKGLDSCCGEMKVLVGKAPRQ